VIRVGVLGASGRMGREVCRVVAAADDLELVAAVDPNNTGLEAEGLLVAATIESLTGADVDVAVDFTHPSTVMPNTRWCLRSGIHAVVGTTGLTPADLDELRLAADAGRANCVVAPNFALGAVLLLRFAAEAARHFDAAEVIELHHDGKADAPSGTAIGPDALASPRHDGPCGVHARGSPGDPRHRRPAGAHRRPRRAARLTRRLH